MSVNEILSNGKINGKYLDYASTVIPISQVTGLQTNLNTLQAEINAIPGSKFSEFFALMPGDNASTVAVGAAVQFPQNGPTNSSIARSSATQFVLPAIGTYEVFFQVSFAEAGQLALDLDGTIIAKSVVGRATGTNQCVGNSLVTTVSLNQVLRVINPAGNAAALTITPTAGGTHAVSANLVIKQLA